VTQPDQDCANCTTTPPDFVLGGPCAQNADCDSSPGAGDGACYAGVMDISVFPVQGYCTIDDGTGTVCETDADCGAGNQCADSLGYRFCLPSCGTEGTCGDDQACMDSFNGYPLDRAACVPGSNSAVDGDACLGFYQCGEYSLCDDSIENPGGICQTYGCTVGDDATCNGGTCVDVNEYPVVGTLCMPTCATDNDCRADEGYRCYDPGDARARYCRHPEIGDVCVTTADCGNGWSCYMGAGDATGYCTQSCTTAGTEDGCSYGSLCEQVGEQDQCVNRCENVGELCDAYNVCTDVGAPNGGACMPIAP